MKTPEKDRWTALPQRYWWVYLFIGLPFFVFLCLIISGVITSPGNETPSLTAQENVQGQLRGGRIVFVRQFINGIPTEDLSVADSGMVSRGPSMITPSFPPPIYTHQPIRKELFTELNNQIQHWCNDFNHPSIDKSRTYFSIGIRCTRFRTRLVKLEESQAPSVLLELFQEIPSPE